MTERQFAFDTSSLSTSKPILATGSYAGVLTNPTVVGKENKQFFTLRKERKWDSTAKEMVETGEYELSGMLMFSVTLTSKRAIKILQIDEPRIFGGMIYFTFDKKTHVLQDNVQLGQILEVLGLTEVDFNESVDWEFDEDIAIPEEFEAIDDIVTKLNALEYAKQFITVVCQTINDSPVKAIVAKQANRENANIQENTLDMGTRSAPFCGFLANEEGFEDDLD